MITSNRNPFAHLKPSQYADSIYYADIFKLGSKVWMITGTGKSEAASIASNFSREADIARDSVGIIQNNNELYGLYDPGAAQKDPIKAEELSKKYKIDYIAHCLNETQTKSIYADKMMEITEVDNRLVALLLTEFTYPAGLARQFFNELEFHWLVNPERRFNRFLQLTDNIVDTKFLLVPWVESAEGKAILYNSYMQK
jgi:hypothetical protein